MTPKRFVFLVHPLVPIAKHLIGLRSGNVGLAIGRRDGCHPDDVCVVARVGFGEVEGLIAAIPMLPHELLADQERALVCMERAVQIAAPVGYVGLGSVLSVIAGRGKPLQERCGLPVTTGNAATAWAAWRVTEQVAEGRPVAVIGSRGTVGKALVDLCSATPDPRELSRFSVLVGAHTTGGSVDPSEVAAGTTLVDVALPRTLGGRPRAGVRVVAGESVTLPPGWRRDGCVYAFHILAGYGHFSVYACLLEPLIGVMLGRSTPWAQGRNLPAEAVRAFGVEAEKLGFRPEVRG